MVSQTLLRGSTRQFQRFVKPFLRSTSSNSSSIGSLQARFKSTAPIEQEQHESESFLTGTSSLYAEQMYENYMQDRMSVHETWRQYFDDLEAGKEYSESQFNRPTVVTSQKKTADVTAADSHLAVGTMSLHFLCFFLRE